MHRPLYWPPDHRAIDPAGRLRQVVASALHAASRGLDRWAHHLTAAPKTVAHEQWLEFHVAPGDNGGTLYVNGRRVGRLPGVMRL